jgi:hypothetical protein
VRASTSNRTVVRHTFEEDERFRMQKDATTGALAPRKPWHLPNSWRIQVRIEYLRIGGRRV